jgi:glycosyltransferase involved in cell wall biosynthesis
MPRQRTLIAKIWQAITRDARPFLQLVSAVRPVLIHAHFGVEGVYALPIARRLGIPLVTTFHGFDASTSPGALLRSGSPSWINYLLFRHRLARDGRVFICVSEYIRDRLIRLGFPRARTCVHYIGVDTQAIQMRSMDEERSTVIHVARLVEKKGTEQLIRAFAQIATDHPQFDLNIVGEGPLRPRLEGLVRELNLVGRVRFQGARSHPDVMSMMRRAAVLALPSVTAATGDAEGLGMVILEAGALGLPVVATRHGGIPEAVEDGVTGYLVPERDIEQLAKRLAQLLADPALRLSMGTNARALMESRFDLRSQTQKLEEIYRRCLA